MSTLSSVRCWSCDAEVADPVGQPRCASCKALQPLPHGTHHFAALGLPFSFNVTEPALDAAFRARSLQVHPDRFSRASDRERRLAAERTAAVNEAHRTLRSPQARAAYLLTLAGVPLDGPTDPSLLMELMESREAAEESPAARAELLQRTDAERARLLEELGTRFADLESQGALGNRALLLPLGERFTRLRYLHRLAEDLSGRRDADPTHPH